MPLEFDNNHIMINIRVFTQHENQVRKIEPFTYYSVIGDPLIYLTKIQIRKYYANIVCEIYQYIKRNISRHFDASLEHSLQTSQFPIYSTPRSISGVRVYKGDYIIWCVLKYHVTITVLQKSIQITNLKEETKINMDEESTMTKKRTVAVAMDGSQQAESAFNCKKIICIIYHYIDNLCDACSCV